MREIKFRAWHTGNKVMFSPEEMGADQLTIMPDGRGFINVSGADTHLSEFMTHMIPMQYTGLKDKNGKEIYEGDILEHRWINTGLLSPVEHISRGVITHVPKDGLGFIVAGFACKCHDNSFMSFGGWDKSCEVIGNIYENPELLKVEK